MSESLLVTIDEAAKRIGLGRSFTYELIRKGQLHAVKIGGARRIAIADLERFVERVRKEGAIVLDG